MFDKLLKEIEKVNILEGEKETKADTFGGKTGIDNKKGDMHKPKDLEEDNASVVAAGGGDYTKTTAPDRKYEEEPEEEEREDDEDIDEDGTWLASPKVDVQQRNFDLDPKEDVDEVRSPVFVSEILQKISQIADMKRLDMWSVRDGAVGLFRYEKDGNAYEVEVRPIDKGTNKELWGDKIKKKEDRNK